MCSTLKKIFFSAIKLRLSYTSYISPIIFTVKKMYIIIKKKFYFFIKLIRVI